MGKKKGKDKNKLARMSEEERQRYLQVIACNYFLYHILNIHDKRKKS